MNAMQLYNKYSDHLKHKYGTKVYKLPINIPVTCPNRDGLISNHGCIFCGDEGAGFEMLPDNMDVKSQIETNKKYIKENYNAEKYIAYFQNFSNTYLPFDKFSQYINQAITDDIVAIYISTRPDCITNEQLNFLESIKHSKSVDIVIELGLQTINHHTLKLLNRGHTLAEFISAVQRIKKRGLEICVHYIIDLPWDDIEDAKEGAKILSAVEINQVKLHSLFVLKNTALGKMFESNEFLPVSLEEYINRVIAFLEYLSPEIVIQRLIGRAPEERTLFCNWGMSWWKIRDIIEENMRQQCSYQGKRFDYLEAKEKP
jgi:hypothetical protein